jgi:DNA-directed RNA polymerase subunit RPC12/RpoP
VEAEVIHLPVKKKKAQDFGPSYYCLRCDGGDFHLHANGVVNCSRCGSLMRNLFVTQMPGVA